MGEIILAVPDKIIREIGVPVGVSTLPVEEVAVIMKSISDHIIQEDRDKLESNPEFRQLIPYVTVCAGDSIFSAIRTKEGGDARLHGKRIIGFGGHANPIDNAFSKTASAMLRANAMRELEEELDFKGTFTLTFNGFINDYSTPVNSDHLGIYMKAFVEADTSVTVKEKSVLVDGRFYSIEELLSLHDRMESWSSMLLHVIGAKHDDSEV